MPKVILEPATAEEVRQHRRASYRRGAETKERARRDKRRAALELRESNIATAVDAYTQLTWHDVRLRADGLVINPPRRLPPRLGGEELAAGWTNARWREWEQSTRRPLAALAGHRGNAMNFYVTMLFDVACQGLTPGEVAVNRHPTVTARDYREVAWAKLCGLGARPAEVRSRRETMARALKFMGKLGVIEPGVRNVHGSVVEGFSFCHEAGTANPGPYVLPDGSEEVIEIPREFFINGWNLALTSAEIGMFLTVVDAYKRFQGVPRMWFEEGVELTQHLRHSAYGISSETYESLHTLAEFGLIDCTDPMVARTKGKLLPPDDTQRGDYLKEGFNLSPVPYRLRPRLEGLNNLAFDTVHNALKSSLPPRMQDFFDAYDPSPDLLAALMFPPNPLSTTPSATTKTEPAAVAPAAPISPLASGMAVFTGALTPGTDGKPAV